MRWSRTITVVDCHAEGESGQVVVGGVKVERVRFVNQPAFCYHLDATIDVPGIGQLIADIAYGPASG